MSKPIDILVIDDEQVVRDGVCRVCEAGGLTIESAAEARTGLEKLQKNTYRLVVCDIMLPELNGFYILDSMKRVGVLTPLIMITGYSTMQNAVNALKNGAIDFVPKPFTADELESAIHRGLRYHTLTQNTVPRGEGEIDLSGLAVPCPANYHRLGNLSWACIEPNGSGLIGVTDIFVKTVSAVAEVRYYDLNYEIVQGSACAEIASEDGLVHNVLSPISGRIVERNETLLASPKALEKDPYFAAWLYRILPTDVAYALKQLTTCIGDH
ncbi:MAG: response regulator [bacterium]